MHSKNIYEIYINSLSGVISTLSFGEILLSNQVLLTMKMKSKEEKENWKNHAREKRGSTLSGLIRKLMQDDIDDITPKVNPIVLQKEMKELKELNQSMFTFLRTNYPQSEESQSIKWTFDYIEGQIISKIQSNVRQGNIRNTLIKETKEIFRRERDNFII